MNFRRLLANFLTGDSRKSRTITEKWGNKMKLAIGIILILVASWFLYGTIRMWPPGRHRPRMLWPSTRADIVRGVFLVIATCVTGVALIRGASWWWLLVAGISVFVWSVVEGVLRRRRFEEILKRRGESPQE